MVDGGWGVLQDPNIIWIGHHLVFRAGGLSECSDARSAPVERCAYEMGFVPFTAPVGLPVIEKVDSCTRAPCPRARIHSVCRKIALLRRGRYKTRNARFSRSTADDHDSGSRRDRKLGNPSDDLSILCWGLEALPTHHLPWAGFGLRQPHWLIQQSMFEK